MASPWTNGIQNGNAPRQNQNPYTQPNAHRQDENQPRPFTLNEALPYTPFTSVFPFESGKRNWPARLPLRVFLLADPFSSVCLKPSVPCVALAAAQLTVVSSQTSSTTLRSAPVRLRPRSLVSSPEKTTMR